MFFALAPNQILVVEGGDLANTYLYGNLDIDNFIEQPTDSTGITEKPGYIFRLLKSMYGLRQAGKM